MTATEREPLGVVLPAFNAAEVLGNCLDSLLPYASALEIVVVDNASRDATAEIAAAHDVAPTLLRMDANLGFGGALNAGVEALKAPDSLLLNPDAEVTKLDLELLEELRSRPRHGLLAITDAGGVAGPYLEPGVIREAYEQVVQLPRLRRAPDGAAQGRATTCWISGWGMLVRRSEFLDLGGFDQRYFVYYEDRDLSRKYRRAGLPLGLTGAVEAAHDQGTGASEEEFPSGVRTSYSLLAFAEYRQDGRFALPSQLTVVLLVVLMLAARLLLRLVARASPQGGRLERRALAIESTLTTLDRFAADLGPAARAYPRAKRALPAVSRLIPRSLAAEAPASPSRA